MFFVCVRALRIYARRVMNVLGIGKGYDELFPTIPTDVNRKPYPYGSANNVVYITFLIFIAVAGGIIQIIFAVRKSRKQSTAHDIF